MSKNGRPHRAASAANQHVRKGARIVRRYGVYAASTLDRIEASDVPLFFLTREERDKWMEDGALRSVNRGRDCRLVRSAGVVTQPSQAMGPGIAEGVAGDKPFAESCAEAWTPGWTARTGQVARMAPEWNRYGEAA